MGLWNLEDYVIMISFCAGWHPWFFWKLFKLLVNDGLNNINCVYSHRFIGSLKWGLSLLQKGCCNWCIPPMKWWTHERNWGQMGIDQEWCGVEKCFRSISVDIGKVVFYPLLWMLPFEFHDLKSKFVLAWVYGTRDLEPWEPLGSSYTAIDHSRNPWFFPTFAGRSWRPRRGNRNKRKKNELAAGISRSFFTPIWNYKRIRRRKSGFHHFRSFMTPKDNYPLFFPHN